MQNKQVFEKRTHKMVANFGKELASMESMQRRAACLYGRFMHIFPGETESTCRWKIHEDGVATREIDLDDGRFFIEYGYHINGVIYVADNIRIRLLN